MLITAPSSFSTAIRISLFFFFNDTATTEIYTFPYTTLFRSQQCQPRRIRRRAVQQALDQRRALGCVRDDRAVPPRLEGRELLLRRDALRGYGDARALSARRDDQYHAMDDWSVQLDQAQCSDVRRQRNQTRQRRRTQPDRRARASATLLSGARHQPLTAA